MATKEYAFKVAMTCEGCSGAVKRSLTRTYGDQLAGVDADIPSQRVTVTLKAGDGGSLPTPDQVLEAVKKAGKETTLLA